MDKLSVRSCMLCERDLKDSPSVVHAHCVPFDQLIMLCNCKEVTIFKNPEIPEMVAYLNCTLEEQQSADLLKKNGGQFILVSECSWCNEDTDGEDFQIMFIYERLSEAN